VPKLIVAPNQEEDGVVWSFLDRPHEAHVTENGDQVLEPIRYAYGDAIGISFRLEGATGEPLAKQSAFVDVCAPPRYSAGGAETCSFVVMIKVDCSSNGQYTYSLPTAGSDGMPRLRPGRYMLTLGVNAIPIESAWIQVVAGEG